MSADPWLDGWPPPQWAHGNYSLAPSLKGKGGVLPTSLSFIKTLLGWCAASPARPLEHTSLSRDEHT